MKTNKQKGKTMNKIKILRIILTILNIIISYILIYERYRYIFFVCVFLLIFTIAFNIMEYKKDKKFLNNYTSWICFMSLVNLIGAIVKYFL